MKIYISTFKYKLLYKIIGGCVVLSKKSKLKIKLKKKTKLIIILTLSMFFIVGIVKIQNILIQTREKQQETVVKPIQTIPKNYPKRELKYKDKGEDVKYIQERLKEYGYNMSTEGIFGWGTREAIFDFQYKVGMPPTGTADLITIKELDKKPTEKTKYIPPNPIDYTYINSDINKFVNENGIRSYTDYLIITSLDNKLTYIFKGTTNNYTLIQRFYCSVGSSNDPTVPGQFRVGMKGLSFGQDDGFQAKYFTQINGNYLYHSVIYNKEGTKIVDGSLGDSVSHGCIRLATEHAKWIYDNVPENSTIIIK
jgi:lipoprotein-anchoring transpeptidase ErfK/SrfK